MSLILLLLLIPVFFVGLIMFIMTLVQYSLGNGLDTIIFLVGLFILTISGFIIPKFLFKLFPDKVFFMNQDNYASSTYSYFMFILLFMFGISNLVNSIIGGYKVLEFAVGIVIILLFLYVSINYMFKYEDIILELDSIDDDKNKNYCLNFYSEETGLIEYYSKDGNYEEEKFYLVSFNKATRTIKKIKRKVINVD